ncbi:hypothetical protein SAMN05880501_1119 [Ureibacillus xyleni]|uniref:Uncharacterized protein n=1 Tax=Ureibacillus xyleni TaxID=614648 RepID=A0A285TG58_9BACL|nr:hypothetical protein [Ureibacillus xyleni]SOC19505.1 hypothetical protein SAMN05880501_1119 [Ureibacillus xyleni]
MRFELWLDESGDFEKNDQNLRLNPSLVGGVLVRNSSIDECEAENILGKTFVHFTDESGDFNISKLKALKERDAEFVIFQNAERVMIIDSNTTYLNVLSEGIIQLLLQLSAAYGDFELDILVATRKNVVEGRGIIRPEEYEKRLRERIIVGLARKALTKENDWKYKIHFDDARTNKKLMLADGVCNTYLTRTSTKFTAEQKELIEDYYSSELVFSFFEDNVEKEILRWITEGNLSDAIFQIYAEDGLDEKDYLLELALNRLQKLDDHSKKIQLSQLSSKIYTLIKIDRKYTFVKPILVDIQENLLPQLEEKAIHSLEFQLDIILFLYTVYTHLGSTKAEAQDQLFLSYLPQVEDIMTKFKYYNLHKIRKGVHEKNMLKIGSAIDDLSKAIKVFEELILMTELLEDESLSGNKAKYEELGKAYGTRGQAYAALIHENQDYLRLAINDFDHAIEHFTVLNDKERQHLYKALAYCEGNKFPEALQQLFQSCQVPFNSNNFIELLDHLKSHKLKDVIYKFACYFKIMSYAKVNGQDTIADSMFQALNQVNLTVEFIRKNYSGSHPTQFILWYMASFSIARDKRKLALQYIDEAIGICDAMPMTAVTFKILQLGMLAEKSSLFEDAQQIKKELFQLYQDLKNEVTVSANLEYISFLEGLNEVTIAEQELKKLVLVSKGLN